MMRRWAPALGWLLSCAEAGPSPAPAAATLAQQPGAERSGAPSGGGSPAPGAQQLPPAPGAQQLPPAPGAQCELAVRIAGDGASAVLGEASGSAAATALRCGAPAGGGSAHFELDLSAAAQALPVQLLLDAPFAFEAALARGPCGDERLEQCGTPLYPDERSRVIAATLEPDRYRLIVSSAQADAAGEVRASATLGQPRCSQPPANDTCARALRVDTRLPVQSLSGTLDCAQPELPVRCANAAAPDVFYELDLSRRAGETLVELAVAAAANRPVTVALLAPASAACAEVVMCGSQLSARLPPGTYHVAVSESGYAAGESHPELPPALPGEPGPFALRIALSEPDCSHESNDTWQTAIDLDPALPEQRVSGNTACATNQLDTACFADRGAPDLFYRLDLRAKAEPQYLHTRNLVSADTVSYLLLADAPESTPQLVACDAVGSPHERWYQLAPRLYYLVVDGSVRNAGRFELELELRDAPPQRTDCAGNEIRRCMADSEPACARSTLDARCLTAALECGLERAVLEAFCSARSACCTADAEADAGAGACLEQWNVNVMCQ